MKNPPTLIDRAGYMALSTRLQRLAESLRKDGQLIYSDFGLEFEPKFWPVLFTLSQRPGIGVIDIANEIGYTHPSVVALIREMELRKWVRSAKDRNDSRRRLLHLTPVALDMVAKMEPVWDLIRAALTELGEGDISFLTAIETFENRVERDGFLATARRIHQDRVNHAIRIIDYEPPHQKAFESLNMAWIAKDFEVEEVDRQTLGQPEVYFLQDGGAILLAEKDGQIVGTVALQNFGDQGYELAKMAVDERLRGQKIGEKLCHAALLRARDLGAKTVFLFSNTKNVAALNLYFKLGFRVVPLGESEFTRANIKMALDIKT